MSFDIRHRLICQILFERHPYIVPNSELRRELARRINLAPVAVPLNPQRIAGALRALKLRQVIDRLSLPLPEGAGYGWVLEYPCAHVIAAMAARR